MKDVKRDLVAFLRAHFDETALSVPLTPGDPATPNDADGEIRIADFDGGLDYPGIYLQAENTVVPNSGVTGFTGMDPGSGGPTQDPVTSVQVDCWGGTTQTDRLINHGVHPDTLASEMANQVWRTCLNNSGGPDGYRYVSVSEPTEGNDTDASPTAFRRIVPVEVGYHVRPE